MQDQTPDFVTIGQILGILKRHKWMLGSCIVVSVALTYTYNRLAIPIYTAPAIISFEQYGDDSVLNLGFGSAQYQSNIVANCIKELKTWTFAQNVFRALPDSLRQLFVLPDSDSTDFDSQRYLVQKIQDNISVEQTEKNSNVLTIAFDSENAQLAQEVTNIAIDVLRARNLIYRRQEFASLKGFIDEQLKVVEQDLDSAEQALQDFKGDNNIASLEDESREILTRITQAENLYNQILSDTQAKKKKLSVIQQKIDEQKENISTSSPETSNPMIVKLREQLIRLEMESASLQVQGYSDDHPRRLELTTEIERVKENLVNLTMGVIQDRNLKGMIDPLSSLKEYLEESVAIEIEIQALLAQQRHLGETLNSYNSRLRSLSQKDGTLFGLARDREVSNKLYVHLLEEREQARLREAAEIGSMRVIERAQLPLFPYKPRKELNLIIAFITGSMVGLLLIFLQDSLDNTPHAQEEVETMLQLPVLTSVPKIKRKWTVPLNGVAKNHYDVQLYQDAYSYLLHAIRTQTGEKPYSVMITSATPGEGKSTISANLAIAAANFGYGTLLIDGDLRRPSLAKLLQASDSVGLSDIISGQYELQDLPVKRLKFLSAGSLQEKPAIFWNSPPVREAIRSLKEDFDFVVIDSPPVLGIPDAVSIASYVDEIILCVGVEQVDRTLLLRVRKILKQTNRNLVGVVWNKVNETNIYGKYKYHKYYKDKAKNYA